MNLTIGSVPRLVEPAHHPEFNSNTDLVEDLEKFPYLKHNENITDLKSQSVPSPLPRTDIYPGAGAPLSYHIAEPWERDTQGCLGSGKIISVWAEWQCQSGQALSESSETPPWQITGCAASIARVALHIALRLQVCRFFSPCRSPMLNKHSCLVANCGHMSELVHWVLTCIRIAMQWVKMQTSLLTFLLHQHTVNQCGSHT